MPKILQGDVGLPTFLYGSENWTLTKDEVGRNQAVEMRFLGHVAGCALCDRKRNADIRQELNTESILDRISKYRLNWLNHLNRMDDCRNHIVCRKDGEVSDVRGNFGDSSCRLYFFEAGPNIAV